MYQTLYRKYRPNNFDEVVGQNAIVRTLKNEIKSNQLNHAYLFAGPRGTGKTSIAKILAKTINCINPNGGNACNKCVSCTQINQKQSTDIIEIDAASNNGVDEIRELKSKVNLVPSSGKYKVYIIDEVHMLTIGAFNALLKTLEEPPAHIIFILATTDPHKIPATILSRCQRFDFKKISIENLVKRLKQIAENENISITLNALTEIARLADGGMRDALSMLDQVTAFSEGEINEDDVHEINGTLSQKEMIKNLENIIENNLSEELNILDELNDNGKNLVKFTEELIQLMRNVLLYQTAPDYFKEKTVDISMFQNISREISTNELLKMIQQLNRSLSDMKFSNNPKLILELAMIQLMNFEHSDTVKLEKEEKTSFSENKVSSSEKIGYVDENRSELQKNNIEHEKKDVLKDNEVEQIKQETPEQKVVQNLDLMKQLEEVKLVRINNALAGFNKKEYLEIKNKMQDLVSLLIDPSCSKYISMIFDATLKAFGNNYLIYVYEDTKLSDIFNYNLVTLESIINKHFNTQYKLISVDMNHWEKIKQEFNSKTKQYIMQEEPYDIKAILSKNDNSDGKNNDPIQSLFGNIVEYEEE